MSLDLSFAFPLTAWMHGRVWKAAIFGLLAAVAPAGARAEAEGKIEPANQAYFKEFYTKYESMIPMRDGVSLHTAWYAPKDTGTYPILLTRTPYGERPYGEDRYPDPGGVMRHYGREMFIFATQDVRGRNASEGVFTHVRPQLDVKSGPTDVDESTDAYDTIDWLVKHVPHNNGKVGMTGISYPGFYAAAGMIDSHPALKCVSPQAPIADWFIGDDFHHNGTFYLPHAVGFFSGFGQKLEEPTREQPKPFDYKTPDGYAFFLKAGPLANIDKLYFKGRIEFWGELMEHGNYDSFWRARALGPHLKNIKSAVMTVGGWFDAEDLYGALRVYREVARNNPGTTNLLVMGPWPHGGWSGDEADRLGNIHFQANTAEYFQRNLELPFLKRYLKGEGQADLAGATVFETGTAQWRRFQSWPPAGARPVSFYIRAGGGLTSTPPGDESVPFDEYVSDPAHPVPFIPGIAIGMAREHMLEDQRFAERRPDVLVYQTGVLNEDVTVAGPVSARLAVSTTGTDSDWVVKLIDVYPGDYPDPEPNPAGVRMGGYEQLVRGEAMRGKFRNSYEKPEPFEPGRPARVDYVLPDVCHTFRRGHRIMAQIQSTWFPLVDRNPQKFCDIYHATEGDFQKATQRVYHAGKLASHIDLMVLPPAR